MLPSRESTPAKPKTLALQKKRVSEVMQISGPAELENRIRERAYQLYDARGCEPGKDQQDWLQAEHEIVDPRP
jgi:hypothetical protein